MPIFEVDLSNRSKAEFAVVAESHDELTNALDDLTDDQAERLFDFWSSDGFEVDHIRENPATAFRVEYGVWDGKFVKPSEYERLKQESEIPGLAEWREYDATQPHLIEV